MNGIMKDELLNHATKELKNTFTPQQLLKGMDITSGSLNLSAIDVIRENVEGTKKGCVGIITSSSNIHRVETKVVAYADKLIPFTSFETSTGEGIKFDDVKLLKSLLISYSLLPAAKVEVFDRC